MAAKRAINSDISIKKEKAAAQQEEKANKKPSSVAPQKRINTSASIKMNPFKKVQSQKPIKFGGDYFLIKRELLPKKVLQVVKVKEAMYRGDAVTLKDALEEFDITANTYHKYKNSVIPFFEATSGKIFTLNIETEQKETVLANIVSVITKRSGNILTLNQGFPINKTMSISISLDTSSLSVDLHLLLFELKSIDSVRRVEVMGRVSNTLLSKYNMPDKIQDNF